jgi:hypothetical protein
LLYSTADIMIIPTEFILSPQNWIARRGAFQPIAFGLVIASSVAVWVLSEAVLAGRGSSESKPVHSIHMNADK